MKKFLSLFVMMLCFSLVCSAKSFYYYGVGFEHERGWMISGSPNGIIGTCDDYRLYINFSKITSNHANLQGFIAVELEKKIDDILERSFGNKKMKIKKKSEIAEGDVNGIPAQYVDITFASGICKRYYCFEWEGYKFDLEISGKGNSFHKAFKKILNSFAFTPEMR